MQEEKKTVKMEKCELQATQGIEAWCSREACIYWRLLEPQDIDGVENPGCGCGLQEYKILDQVSDEMSAWLLSMKRRLENTSPESAKSRITFRRREKE